MHHNKKEEASMTVLRPRVGEHLHCGDTTLLQHAMMVKEHHDGEHPHPQ